MIQADGSQPEELARTKSMNYTAKNLNYLLQLAFISLKLDVNLAGFCAPSGSSLRTSVDWLVPYWTAEKPWRHEQVTAFTRERSLRASTAPAASTMNLPKRWPFRESRTRISPNLPLIAFTFSGRKATSVDQPRSSSCQITPTGQPTHKQEAPESC
jgi:hypothetical protein